MVLGQSFHYFLKNTCLTEIHQKGVDHNLGVEIFPLTWCVWLVLRYSGRTASSLGTVIHGAQRWTASWAASRWTTRRSTSGPTSCQHGMCNNTDMFSFYVFLTFLVHVLQCVTNTLLHQIVSHERRPEDAKLLALFEVAFIFILFFKLNTFMYNFQSKRQRRNFFHERQKFWITKY